jgi:RNA 2',3'-cyclic 3'-phosphodiesterase
MASRTFFAIDSPASVRLVLERLSANLASLRARPTDLQNLHITALFLGQEVEKQILEKAIAALSKIRYRSFKCAVSGLGVFTEDRPEVIFAKVSSGIEELSGLNATLRDSLAKSGIETETRYHPHLTLARVKSGTDVDGVMALVKESKEPQFSFLCRELKLKQSRESKGAMTYVDLASVPLL